MGHSTVPISNDLHQTVVNMITSGFTAKEIQKVTGVAPSTQRLFAKKAQNGTLMVIKPDRTGLKNGRAKRPASYELKLRSLIAKKGLLYDRELAEKMYELTDCKLSAVQVGRIRKNLGITRKKLSIHFPERYLERNMLLAKEFCEKHRRVKPVISLWHCASTDECGFKNDLK